MSKKTEELKELVGLPKEETLEEVEDRPCLVTEVEGFIYSLDVAESKNPIANPIPKTIKLTIHHMDSMYRCLLDHWEDLRGLPAKNSFPLHLLYMSEASKLSFLRSKKESYLFALKELDLDPEKLKEGGYDNNRAVKAYYSSQDTYVEYMAELQPLVDSRSGGGADQQHNQYLKKFMVKMFILATSKYDLCGNLQHIYTEEEVMFDNYFLQYSDIIDDLFRVTVSRVVAHALESLKKSSQSRIEVEALVSALAASEKNLKKTEEKKDKTKKEKSSSEGIRETNSGSLPALPRKLKSLEEP